MMMRTIRLAVACVAVLVATAGQLQAGVMIEYSDVGSDLLFSWSGSLNAAAGDGVDPPGGPFYATIGNQGGLGGNFPTFYSAPQSHPPVVPSITYTGPNNPGLFATLAPNWESIMPGSTSTGLPFMFRIDNAVSGTTSLNVWADWGAANSPIVGTMTIASQSAASMGMVDGYTIETSAGTIEFRDANIGAVPEPSSLAVFGIGAFVAGAARRRRREKQQETTA